MRSAMHRLVDLVGFIAGRVADFVGVLADGLADLMRVLPDALVFFLRFRGWLGGRLILVLRERRRGKARGRGNQCER